VLHPLEQPPVELEAELLPTVGEQAEVDVVFCDIKMPALSGLELARVLSQFKQRPQIVFVTAYDEHAVDVHDVLDLIGPCEHRVFSDADLSTPIDELPQLRAQLHDRCAVAIASCALPLSQIDVHQPGRRETMGRMYNRLLRVVALPGLHDTQCGFKVFTAEAAAACFGPLRTKGFGFDAEVLLRARRLGWTVAEVPVRWSHREDSRVSPVRDSARTLLDLLRLRLNGR